MAEVAQGTQQEFWRPPAPLVDDAAIILQSSPTMAETCPRCGREFLSGSHFCHTCGGRRPQAISAATKADAAAIATMWEEVVHSSGLLIKSWKEIEFPAWLQYLHFHEIKSRLGLSTASLISFVIGMGCVAGALLVGLLTAKTLVDWQAIQFYRAEWLLAATAAFVAGILLKKRSSEENND